MASITRGVQQLSREQLELANFFERAKNNHKEEGLLLKKTINGSIVRLLINLWLFLSSYTLHSYLISRNRQYPKFLLFMLLALSWVSVSCLITYLTVDWKIKRIDRLLQRDEVLKRNVDVFARNIRDSIEMYQVTSEFRGGPVVALDVKVFPHIVDRGVYISQLATLKQLVEEPLVEFNYRFIYRLIVAALFSFGILLIIGLAVIADYAMEGDEHLNLVLLPT